MTKSRELKRYVAQRHDHVSKPKQGKATVSAKEHAALQREHAAMQKERAAMQKEMQV